MFKEYFWGQNGFDELRKYVKQGNEFCREVGGVMVERSDLEATYAKALTKLSGKLTKSAQACMGTLAEAWSMAAAEMECEAELHRQLSQALNEDLYKPLKTLADTQHKTRKPIESMVDKAFKNYTDKKSDESKYKKNAFQAAKDREKMFDLINKAKAGHGKNTTEKDIVKMEKSLRKLEDSLRKYDKSYHESCQHAEQARQEWDSTIYKANAALQQLEEERISQLQDLMNKYNSHLAVIGPKLTKSCEKLGEAVISIDTNSDIRKVIDAKGSGAHQPEQTLPDYYAEDMHNPMEAERRRQLLQNYLIYLQQDIERELKGKEGVEKLVEVYQSRPNFADAEAQEDARHRLAHVNAMLNFLEAAHFKLSCAMSELEGRPKPTSKFSQYIERTKDKQGQNISILRVPSSMVFEGYVTDAASAATYSRGPADGGQVDPPFGEVVKPPAPPAFKTQSLGRDPRRRGQYENVAPKSLNRQPTAPASSVNPAPSTRNMLASTTSAISIASYDDDEFDPYDTLGSEMLCKARAIYDYTAQQYDELTIAPGDVISVFDKQEDGWWQGELNGKVGIFPATYVEEIH